MTTKYPFMRIEISLAGEIDVARIRATASGETEVTYRRMDWKVYGIAVKAQCDDQQQWAIRDLLAAYRDAGWMQKVDRVCLHDSTFEIRHENRCDIESYEALAAALQVEIQALLADRARPRSARGEPPSAPVGA